MSRQIHIIFDPETDIDGQGMAGPFVDLAAYCEQVTPTSIPFPDRASVYISKRCADTSIGRTFTAVLVELSTNAWMKAA